MTLKRHRAKGRREGGAFAPIPCTVLNHDNYKRLSPSAVKLLFDLIAQLRFSEGGTKNNGDTTACWSVMRERHWKSKETLQNAKKELLHYGFIVVTRTGQRFRSCPELLAITFWAIDPCNGKLEVSETRTPPSNWKKTATPYTRPKRKK